MAKKITDLVAISGGTFSTTDLFEVSVDIGAGSFVSRKITGQEIIDSLTFENLGNTDLTQSATGTRTYTLAGNASSDKLTIEKNNGTDIVQFKGNGEVFVGANVKIGTDIDFDGAGAHNMDLGGNLSTDYFSIRNASATDMFIVRGSQNIWSVADHIIGDFSSALGSLTVKNASGIGQYIVGESGQTGLNIYANTKDKALPLFIHNRVSSGATGENRGAYVFMDSGNASVTNIGLKSYLTANGATSKGIELNVSGATNNYAIDIVAGDINTTGGTGLSGTYTFGGGSSGDIASMTFTVGILTAVTTVP